MNISVLEIIVPSAKRVKVTPDILEAELEDGRVISVPTAWFPRLTHATAVELLNWRLVGKGQGIHWDDLDEDISIESLIAGRASAETQSSLATWLSNRKAKHG
jgi:Protein of unknown function (DUF2442)